MIQRPSRATGMPKDHCETLSRFKCYAKGPPGYFYSLPTSEVEDYLLLSARHVEKAADHILNRMHA